MLSLCPTCRAQGWDVEQRQSLAWYFPHVLRDRWRVEQKGRQEWELNRLGISCPIPKIPSPFAADVEQQKQDPPRPSKPQSCPCEMGPWLIPWDPGVVPAPFPAASALSLSLPVGWIQAAD